MGKKVFARKPERIIEVINRLKEAPYKELLIVRDFTVK